MSETKRTADSGWSQSQSAAIRARGRNVIVSAGAGSGKTSVLVERVVHCVTADPAVQLTELLVVTFTEAAAAEMRSRIGRRLAELADEATSEAEVRQVSKLTGQLDQAQISTLHSFCMQVVRDNYLLLDLDAGFDMLSEEDSVVLKTACLEEVVETWLSGSQADAFRAMMDRFGMQQPTQLAKLIFRVDTFARSQASPEAWLEQLRTHYAAAQTQPFDSLAWTDGFAAWCERRLADARMFAEMGRDLVDSVPELKSYRDALADFAPIVADALAAVAARDWEGALANLLLLGGLKSPRAKAHPLKDTVADLRKQAQNRVKTVQEVLARGTEALQTDIRQLAPAISTLVDVILDFQRAFMERKRADAVLDFNDLEHLALQVLRDESSGEAARLQAKFAEIFVDEFQDTSPIQDAVVQSVSRAHGNVFVVGDVKQSIYRFRMAEPTLFLDKYFGESGYDPIHLAENYRSRREVVASVNHLFSQYFSEDFGGAPYDDDARMEPGAYYPEASDVPEGVHTLRGPVEVHLLERNPTDDEMSGADPSAEDRLDSGFGGNVDAAYDDESDATRGDDDSPEDLLSIEREGALIAQRIRSFMGMDGGPHRQVWDARRKTFRPLEFRDIVILMRSVKGRITPLLEVLRQHGIPGYGVASTGFYGALEVQWLLAAMAVVDNPRREIELVATMRSPMFGFTDAELAEIRSASAGNFYDVLRTIAKGKPEEHSAPPTMLSQALRAKVLAFLRTVSSWRRWSRMANAAAVLQRIVDETAMLPYITAMPGGRVRSANVQVLMDKVRAYDMHAADGIFGFVRHARELLQYEIDFGEARTLAEGEDVVRIMTIHQSKGLEFPVVFVADLGKQFYRDPLDKTFPLHRHMGFGPTLTDAATEQRWRTVPSLAIEDAELKEFLAEEARILYVAVTRARERLVLVGSALKLDSVIVKARRSAVAVTQCYPVHTLLQAKTMLDWLLLALWRHPDGRDALSASDVGDEEGADAAGASISFEPEPHVVRTEGSRYQIQVWHTLPEAGPGADPGMMADDAGAPALRAAHAMLQRGVEARDQTDLLYALQALEQAALDRAGEASPVGAQSSAASPSGTESSPSDAETGAVQAATLQPLDSARYRDGTGTQAKLSATDLRRLWTAAQNKGHERSIASRASAEGLLEDPVWLTGRGLSGREQGTAFHAVMQHIDLSVEPNEATVTAELDRLADCGRIDPTTRAACNPTGIVNFLQSELGQLVRGSQNVLREQPFFHRLSVGHGSDEFIIVQGVIDCLCELEDRWLIVDYKTDNVTARDVEKVAGEYAGQISVYVEVAETVLGRTKPIEAWLYFVRPAVSVSAQPVDLRKLFEA